MAKKNFAGGLNSLLGNTNNQSNTSNTENTNNSSNISNSAQTAVQTIKRPDSPKEGETRATFIISQNQLEKLKALAYWKREKIKDVLAQAVQSYIDQYEQENGSEYVSTYKKQG